MKYTQNKYQIALESRLDPAIDEKWIPEHIDQN